MINWYVSHWRSLCVFIVVVFVVVVVGNILFLHPVRYKYSSILMNSVTN